MVQWGDIPTWVLAGIAFLALIGAALAYRAQSEQLRLQRIQLEDQTRVQEREQANLVDVTVDSIDGAQAKVLPDDKSEPVHMIVVTNGSKRPIREVSVMLQAIRADRRIEGDPDRVGNVRTVGAEEPVLAQVRGLLGTYGLGTTPQGRTFVPTERSGDMPLLRAGVTAAFVWPFTKAIYPTSLWRVWFTDDAGLHWQIDINLHLKKVDKGRWWDRHSWAGLGHDQ